MSALPNFTMRQLLDAGVHFGHKTMRWNPAMEPYIFGSRNNIHIIDLQKTVPMLHNALTVARDVAANNGRILFVSTKRQASSIVAESAKRCGQYYVNHRWLGGMLTNWGTISKSIKTLNSLRSQLEDEDLNLNKKERLQINRKIDKLELALGGIKDMGGVPDLLFIIDTNKESIAVLEAKKLGIPVIAVVDSNSNPEGISHIIPGNDDATRSIELYCDLISGAVLSGMKSVLKEDIATPANDTDIEKKSAPKKAEKAKPTAKKPAAKKPVAKKDAASEATKVASTEKKNADVIEEKDKAVDKKPTAKKPTAKKPSTKKTAAKKAS